MGNPTTIGIAAWLLPGAGYWMAGRRTRAVAVGIIVWAMFIIAVMGNGLHYPGFVFKDGPLLYLLNIFSRSGNGLGLILGYFWTSVFPAGDAAAKASFEYAGRFLEVAGLINFLALLDAVDIRLGRKG